MEIVKALSLLLVGGAGVFGITLALGKIPALFTKNKKKKSCCG